MIEEVELFHWTTLERPSVADRFQPIEGAHFDEVIATKLTVDPWLPMAGLEEADHQELLPVTA